MRSPQQEQWQQAMKDEFDSLIENRTWEYQHLLEGRKIVKNKWIYKIKLAAVGSVDRFKARLVARDSHRRRAWTLLRHIVE